MGRGGWRGRGGQKAVRGQRRGGRGHTRHISLGDSSSVLNERVLPRPPRRQRPPATAGAPPVPPRADDGRETVSHVEKSVAVFDVERESEKKERRSSTQEIIVTPREAEGKEEAEAAAARPLLSDKRSTSQPALKQNLAPRQTKSRASGTAASAGRLQPLRKAAPIAAPLTVLTSNPAENTARRFAPLLAEKLQKFLDTHSALAKATAAQSRQLTDYAELRLATRSKDEAVLKCANTTAGLLGKLSDEIKGMCSSAAEDSKRKRQEQRPDLREMGNILDTLRALHHMYSNFSEECNSTVPAMLEYRSRVSAVELNDMDEVGDEVEEGTDVVKQGYLWKKGGSRRNWKFRWFILKPRIMYYFNNEKDKKLLGTVSLVNCTVGTVNIRRPHCFAVSAKDRIFQMSAADDQQRGEWMSAIMKCIELDMGGDPAKLAHISRQHSATVAEKRPTPAPEPVVGSLHVGFAGATTVSVRRSPSPQVRKLQMKSASSDILRAMAKSATQKAELQQGQRQQQQLNRCDSEDGFAGKQQQQQQQQQRAVFDKAQQEHLQQHQLRLQQEDSSPYTSEEESGEEELVPSEHALAEAEAKLAEVNKRYSVQYVWMRQNG